MMKHKQIIGGAAVVLVPFETDAGMHEQWAPVLCNNDGLQLSLWPALFLQVVTIASLARGDDTPRQWTGCTVSVVSLLLLWSDHCFNTRKVDRERESDGAWTGDIFRVRLTCGTLLLWWARRIQRIVYSGWWLQSPATKCVQLLPVGFPSSIAVDLYDHIGISLSASQRGKLPSLEVFPLTLISSSPFDFLFVFFIFYLWYQHFIYINI